MNKAKEGRTAILGLLLVSGILLVGRGLPMWNRWSIAQYEKARQTARILGAARSLLSDSASRAEALTLMVEELNQQDWVFDAPNPSLASVLAGRMLADAAEEHGVTISSVQQADTGRRSGDRLRKLRLRISIAGSLSSLASFLAAVESRTPHIAVKQLVLSQPETSLPANRPETIRGELLLELLYGAGQIPPAKGGP